MPSPVLDISEIDRLNLQGLSCLVANRKQAGRLARIAHKAAKAIGYSRGAESAAGASTAPVRRQHSSSGRQVDSIGGAGTGATRVMLLT